MSNHGLMTYSSLGPRRTFAYDRCSVIRSLTDVYARVSTMADGRCLFLSPRLNVHMNRSNNHRMFVDSDAVVIPLHPVHLCFICAHGKYEYARILAYG